MTVPLPIQLPVPSSWQLTDWRDLILRTGPSAGGVATAQTDSVPDSEMWLIDRAVISCTTPAGVNAPAQLRLYDTSTAPLALVDGSDSGAFDVAEYPTGLRISSTHVLIAVWTGATDGAVGTLRAQARIFRKG